MKPALLASAVLVLAAPAAAQDLREQLDAIYGRGGYQRELPVDGEPARETHRRGEPRAWGGNAHEARPDPDAGRVSSWIAGLASAIVAMLPWIGLAVLVAFFVLVLLRSRRPARAGPASKPAVAAEPAVDGEGAGRAAGSDAEELARSGRFGEAIHALLLGAIDRIAVESPQAAVPALTSRELATRAGLAPERRAAFDRLVRAVELVLFGGRDAGEPEYRACAADLSVVGGSR